MFSPLTLVGGLAHLFQYLCKKLELKRGWVYKCNVGLRYVLYGTYIRAGATGMAGTAMAVPLFEGEKK